MLDQPIAQQGAAAVTTLEEVIELLGQLLVG